jgi:hypothetical protein
MSIFGNILNKIFHHSTAQASTGTATAQPQTQPQSQAGFEHGRERVNCAAFGSASGSGQPTLKNVDVQVVLSQLATQKGGGGNWRTSVVDLLKCWISTPA